MKLCQSLPIFCDSSPQVVELSLFLFSLGERGDLTISRNALISGTSVVVWGTREACVHCQKKGLPGRFLGLVGKVYKVPHLFFKDSLFWVFHNKNEWMKRNLFSVCLFPPRTLYFPPQKGTETKELKIRKTLKKVAGFPNLFMAFASTPPPTKKTFSG